MPGKGLPLNDDHGHRRRFAMRKRHQSAYAPELLEPLPGRSMQAKFRRAIAAREDFNIPPEIRRAHG